MLHSRKDTWSRRLAALDQRAYDRVAARPAPLLDRVLPRLTRAADHGVLWAVAAAALAAPDSPRLRRAALRGVLAVSIASPAANVAAKGLVRRPRPVVDGVPALRRLRRFPSTSSWPSGHSASAAAFALGVGLDVPEAGVPLGLLASAVAYSRVHVGVHYPGDVLAGVALGAASAAVTLRLLPRRPRAAAWAPAAVDAPASADGAGVVLVVNASAGSASDDLVEAFRKELPKAEIERVEEGDDPGEVLERAAARAMVLAVAGGDGTVQGAATVAAEQGLPLAVVPAGTLNHFAQDLGITAIVDTTDAIKAGAAIRVDLGRVTGGGPPRTFVNTFSIGAYPELVAVRESLERRLGKWPAMLVALVRILRDQPPVDVSVDGEPRRLWLLFAGAGGYEPAGFAPTFRPSLDSGCLDLRLVDAAQAGARVRLVLAVLLGRLARCRVYETRRADSVEVRDLGDPPAVRIAVDGEVESDRRAAFRVQLEPVALTVYRPAAARRP